MTILDIRTTTAQQPAAKDRGVARDKRRRRLERLAEVLMSAKTPAQLFETMESYPKKKRQTLRAANSPLALAYRDGALRREGLRGDTVGDAIEFFGLSMREAHALLCDCGYPASRPGFAQNAAIASRARRLAAKLSPGELLEHAVSWVRGARQG